ncbi:MAG TPA: carboxylating nicotinate-nucleotide diphosphorylase [Bacteroidota bacterium]|nr:carboxylating nicotinate-nucleotide diphosphorylase [Bacteroidota bacterium]
MKKLLQKEIRDAIRRAYDEDIRDGDVTSLCTIPAKAKLTGTFIAKEAGVVAGLEIVREAIMMLDKRAQFKTFVNDGDRVKNRQKLAIVTGNGRALLSAERTALNFFQRISGIATATRAYVDAVKGTNAVILDTRKTVPGLRTLDKLAVKLGGGENHRIGLFDMVLIKDNHIEAAGGITQAVSQVWALDKKKLPIEVEVKNLNELREALALKVDRILLDNMSVAEMREAVRITAGRVPLEASGNVTLSNVAKVAATGVDMISIGALTHSVRALDISFLIQE